MLREKLSTTERRLTLSAAIVLTLAYFMPIWQLDIQAPQYPEGLGMTIWLSHMTGNLAQINLLNHYIGMKHITPSAIPELRIMPEVLLLLAGVGVVTAAINRRWLLAGWIAVVVTAGVVGLYDFYRWGYDYGHNLDPHAAIQVPGMSYQPPLLGHKKLLNIDAYSYPAIGGITIGVAVAIAVFALFFARSHKPKSVPKVLALALSLGALWISGCNTPPQPIQIGTDHCETCRMTISDDRFGGELITVKGKIYKFDSLDCLARFYSTNPSGVKTTLVSDFLNRGTLIDVSHAKFLHSARLTTPMGPGIVASRDESGLHALRKQLTGELLDWKSALKLLQSS